MACCRLPQRQLIHLGIDGGASNTRGKRLDADGRVRTAALAGPSSLTLGVEGAWRHIAEVLAAIGIGAEAYPQTHLACALAGTRRSAGRVAFLALGPAFASLTLCSDGHATVLGAHGGRADAAVSIGTGIVGNCVAADGTARQVGGWGFPVRDEASGAWLGRLVLAEALRILDGYDLVATPLHHAVIAAVGPSIDAVAAWTYQAPSTRYATLAPLVVDAADRGDPAGLRLVRRAAYEAEQLVSTLDPPGELPLCLSGSLALPILGHMAERVRTRVRPSQGDACDGALLLARGLAQSDLPT
jgi:glucosamine kinase